MQEDKQIVISRNLLDDTISIKIQTTSFIYKLQWTAQGGYLRGAFSSPSHIISTSSLYLLAYPDGNTTNDNIMTWNHSYSACTPILLTNITSAPFVPPSSIHPLHFCLITRAHLANIPALHINQTGIYNCAGIPFHQALHLFPHCDDN